MHKYSLLILQRPPGGVGTSSSTCLSEDVDEEDLEAPEEGKEVGEEDLLKIMALRRVL